jgi:hypothetical protein
MEISTSLKLKSGGIAVPSDIVAPGPSRRSAK